MNSAAIGRTPLWFTIVGVVALLWNLVGVCFYLGSVGVLGPPFVQEGQPVSPSWVTAAYAIGVFGGAIGSLGLALHQRWARGLLWVSLVALIVDWGWVFVNFGSVALPLGLTVLVIAALLAWLANKGVAKGWLR